MHFNGENFDNFSLTRLTYSGRSYYPSWSPDGEWIVYDSNYNDSTGTGQYTIWKMRNDGTDKENILRNIVSRMPDWSPVNDKIIHIRYFEDLGREIAIVNSSGEDLIRLTFNGSRESYPLYSPDGEKIAFQSHILGTGSINLWIMDKDGSNISQLTTEGIYSSGKPFSWSPDGSEIVYVSYRSDDWSYGNGTLWRININTNLKTQLTFNYLQKD